VGGETKRQKLSEMASSRVGFDRLLEVSLSDFKKNSETGVISGYIDNELNYEAFLCSVNALGHSFSTRDSMQKKSGSKF
jgi:hypothetical protein